CSAALSRPPVHQHYRILTPSCSRRRFNSTRQLRPSCLATTPSSSNWCATCLFASPMSLLTVTTTSSTSTPIPFRNRFAPTRLAARAVVLAPQFHRVSRCYRHVDRGFGILAQYSSELRHFLRDRGRNLSMDSNNRI